jgi:hypothetical protein
MKDSHRRIQSFLEDRRGQIDAGLDLHRTAVCAPERRQLGARRRQFSDRTAATRYEHAPDPPRFEIFEDRQATRLELGSAHPQNVVHVSRRQMVTF